MFSAALQVHYHNLTLGHIPDYPDVDWSYRSVVNIPKLGEMQICRSAEPGITSLASLPDRHTLAPALILI
jgi:hypothetical protein